jgi:RNA recognition motif-containing protein
MEKRLYVGGLHYAVTDDSLRQVFSKAGTVIAASVVLNRMTGKSRGFGFVEMATLQEAQRAVQMFDGKKIEGRIVTVNEARPAEKLKNVTMMR